MAAVHGLETVSGYASGTDNFYLFLILAEFLFPFIFRLTAVVILIMQARRLCHLPLSLQ